MHGVSAFATSHNFWDCCSSERDWSTPTVFCPTGLLAPKNISHGNEVLPQDTTHLIQRPCYQQGSPCQDPADNWTTRRPPDDRKETQTAVVWSCFPCIRSGQNHLATHSKRRKKTRQTEEEVGRQHQRTDRPGVRQVPKGNGEQRKMEKAGCKICGAPTTLAVQGLMMMMINLLFLSLLLSLSPSSSSFFFFFGFLFPFWWVLRISPWVKKTTKQTKQTERKWRMNIFFARFMMRLRLHADSLCILKASKRGRYNELFGIYVEAVRWLVYI